MNSLLPTLKETINKNMDETKFNAYDFNFSKYNKDCLEIAITHDLPLKTAYPKLVATLLLDSKFNEWLTLNELNYLSTEEKIQKLISVVEKYTTNDSGEITRSEINLLQEDIWKVLIEVFLLRVLPQEESIATTEEENKQKEQVVNKITNQNTINTKKSKELPTFDFDNNKPNLGKLTTNQSLSKLVSDEVKQELHKKVETAKKHKTTANSKRSKKKRRYVVLN
jgi:hypothetical protein